MEPFRARPGPPAHPSEPAPREPARAVDRPPEKRYEPATDWYGLEGLSGPHCGAMPAGPIINPDSRDVQVAGVVPRDIALPSDLRGVERVVHIAPERVRHIRNRRPEWFDFCLAHIPDVLAAPDYVGQRVHGDRRRVEFVGLVGRPPRWLLVSVKFLDEKREAWVNSAYPFTDEHLTGRLRTGTLWRVIRGP